MCRVPVYLWRAEFVSEQACDEGEGLSVFTVTQLVEMRADQDHDLFRVLL